jgi:hypothetical protein
VIAISPTRVRPPTYIAHLNWAIRNGQHYSVPAAVKGPHGVIVGDLGCVVVRIPSTSSELASRRRRVVSASARRLRGIPLRRLRLGAQSVSDQVVSRLLSDLRSSSSNRAKIGPNFQTRCSDGSNSASTQAPDQQKRSPADARTATHPEGRSLSDVSRDGAASDDAQTMASAGVWWSMPRRWAVASPSIDDRSPSVLGGLCVGGGNWRQPESSRGIAEAPRCRSIWDSAYADPGHRSFTQYERETVGKRGM